MSRYFEFWAPAAEQLGIEIRGPVSVELPNGEILMAQLHIPEFGAKMGMLVFEQAPSQAASNALIKLGYGYSVFDQPSGEEISTAEDVAEVLRDWGWSGSTSKIPSWL